MVSVSFQSIISSYNRYIRICENILNKVSVSFQSIISSYENEKHYCNISKKFPSPFRVSFLLINISFGKINLLNDKGFRLLSEYHFFLSSLNKSLILSYIVLSFS